MTKIARLIAAMRQNYALIMDAEQEPSHYIAGRTAIPDHGLSLRDVDNHFLRCLRNLDLVWPNSRIPYADPWGCYHGHDVRNCRPDTTARDEESERGPSSPSKLALRPNPNNTRSYSTEASDTGHVSRVDDFAWSRNLGFAVFGNNCRSNRVSHRQLATYQNLLPGMRGLPNRRSIHPTGYSAQFGRRSM